MKVQDGYSETYLLEMLVPWLPPCRFLAHVYQSVMRDWLIVCNTEAYSLDRFQFVCRGPRKHGVSLHSNNNPSSF